MNAKNRIVAISIIMLFFSSFLWKGAEVRSQDNMGIGTLNPEVSALLDLVSSAKGLLVPRMTTAQRDAIVVSAASNGLLIYNTDCNVFNYYKLNAWVSLDGIEVAGGTIVGSSNPCENATGIGYKIPAVPGSITYSWTVPVGATITAGQGTDSITVSFGTIEGVVCVKASNTCGDSDSLCLVIQLSDAPIAPNALPASNFTCTSFDANWTNLPSATTYFLDVSTDAAFGSFVTGYSSLNVGNFITKNITGLTQNSTYYYRVKVLNGCDTSTFSNTISVVTSSPLPPTVTPPTNFTCTSVFANWGASVGATYYLLDVSTVSSFTTFVSPYNALNVNGAITYNITGLTANTTYYYRVRSANVCDTSGYSSTITFGTTPPVAPAATQANNFTCTSFSANWGAVTGAAAYFLEVSTNSGFTTFISTSYPVNTLTTTTFNVSGLTANITYYYRVRADNGCSLSAYSNTITVSTSAPVSPTATAASNFSCTSMNANWGAVFGAVQYYLDVSTSSSFTTYVSGFNDSLVGNVTTYNITGLVANTTYYYRVRADNGCSISSSSNTITIGTTAPVSPTATPADNFTCTSMNANWGAVSGATQYFLDVSTNSAFSTYVGLFHDFLVTNATTYNVTGLVPNTTYYYRVRADNGCSISSYSNTITIGTTAPVSPTATPADNFTCTSVNANWGAVPGATQYHLDVSTNSSFTTYLSGFNDSLVGNVTTFNVTNLVANTTYYYRVRAFNGCSISSNSNTISFGTTAPVSPAATPADNFTCTSMNANWGAVPGATQYFLDVSTNIGFTTFVSGFNDSLVGNVTTYNVTNLIANTIYFYRVRAGNGCSVSLYSNTISIGTTAPISPTATAASNFTCASMNANWGAVVGATTYFLDVATTASFGTSTLTAYQNLSVGNVTTYPVTGLTPNVTYHYRVRADNGCSTSLPSNTVSVGTTAPISPTATNASSFSCTSFNANWGAVAGATTYYIDVASDASFAAGTLLYNNVTVGNTTTFPVSGLAINTTYHYRVRADNGCSISLYSNTISTGTTPPVSPTATAASNITCFSMYANWGAVSGATTYYIDVATDAGFSPGTFVGIYNNKITGNVTTFPVTGLVPNVIYHYRLRADNGCSVSLYSNTISIGTTAPISPTATPASNISCNSLNANWGAVAGAITYYIDVSSNASFAAGTLLYNNTTTGNVTTFYVSGLTVNTTYYYRIKADNGCLVSLYSNTISSGTTPPIPPTATSADNFSCTSFNANWGAVSGATSYLLDVSTDVGFTTTFILQNQSTANATTYNVIGLAPNTTYYYRVRADNGCSISLYSNTITVGTNPPVSPTATSADNFTCTSFNANWGAVTGASSYVLDVSTDVNFVTGFILQNQSTASATTYPVTGLTPNTTYFYRIRASNGCAFSLYSNTITVGTTAPVAPTATSADNFTCVSFNANWGAVTGATSYSIEVSTNASFSTYQTGYANFSVGNVTTYNVTGLTIGSNYFYRIKASNGCSTSLVSNTIPVTTTAPVAPTATNADNFTCVSFNANWGAVTGATSYSIEVSTNASFSTYQTGYNNFSVGNVTTFNVSGLTIGSNYFYRIKASNGCSTSLVSNTIPVTTTAPVAPTAVAATNFTCVSFNANWGAIGGATSYSIEVSTDASFSTYQAGYNNFAVGNVTTFNVSGLTIGANYFYRIKASNGCSTSLVSNTVPVTTTAPVAPTATNADNFTCVSFNANWGAVTGATSYSIEVSTNASFSTYQTGYTNFNVGNVTTYNVTGLTIGSNYYYRIKASNGCSTSLVSNTIPVTTTAPVAPTAVAATNFTCVSFNANWGAVGGATSYSIEVSTDASFSTYQTGYNNFAVGNVTTFNVSGLTIGANYFYRIKASNGCSTSLVSNTVPVTTTAPVAPTATNADNFTCVSFNANWGAVTSATSYSIEVSTNASFSTYQTGYNNFNVGNVTTYNVTGLTVGLNYYYRIKASNGCSTSLVSNTIPVTTTAPVAPTAVAATNFTCVSFNANWGAVGGATSYSIEVSTDASFSTYQTGYNNFAVGNVTTFNVSGLTIGANYFYRIKASNGCSTSLVSNTVPVTTTAPVAPTATNADNFTCVSFNANWGAVTGATSYSIEVSTNASFSTYQTGYNNFSVGNVTTFNVSGLTIGSNYYYRIKASNGCSTSLVSNTIPVTTTAPVAPTATNADNFTCVSFNANWGAVTGATSYSIEVSTNASFSTYQAGYNNFSVGNVTTFNVSGLTIGSNYFYRIKASNGCSTSLVSNTIPVTTTAPVAPTAVAATNFTCVSFNANWGAVGGATSYSIEVSTDASFSTYQTGYNNFAVGNVTTFNVSGLTIGANYFYRIKASNGCSTSLVSNTVPVTTTAPVAPTATNADNFTCVSFNANWGAVTGATSYSIEVSTNASFSTYQTGYNNFNVGNVTTYNVTGLTIGLNYYYRIKASNGCSTSLVSNTIPVTTTAPVAPTAVAATNFTCVSFNANWGAVGGATSYSIEVSTDASFSTYQTGYNNFAVGNVTTFNVSGLTIGANYFYRIKASNGCSTSLVSNTVPVTTTAPVAPTATNADNFTCVSFNANWGAVTSATSYSIEVSTNASFSTYQTGYNNFNVGNVTTYNVTGLTVGLNYFYRIKASNGCSTSLVSNTIPVTTTAPVAPTAVAATNFTCVSFNANWGAVGGATSYSIEVSTDASFSTYQTGYNNFAVGNVTTFNVSGLTIGANYFYRIKASNGCSTSLVSNTVPVTTTAPVAPTATNADNFTCVSFNANWGAVTGATSYSIEVSTNASFSTYQTGYNNFSVGNVTTYNVTGLTVGLNYFYRIKASNGCSTSLVSNTIPVTTTAPVAPTAVAATNFTCVSFNANWGAVGGATSYSIEVSTDASFSTYQTGYNNFAVGNVTTFNVSGLTIGANYFYRIKASNGCSTSLVSNTVPVTTTAPVAPTATNADNFTCVSFNANWGAVTGATSYSIEVSTNASFSTYQTGYNNFSVGNVTTYNVTGLTVGLNYFYRIKASNGCSTSLVSNTIPVTTTAPVAPTAVAATNFTCVSFNANWGAVGGATSYSIEVSTDASFSTYQTGYNNFAVGNVTTFNVSGLTIGANYFYRIKASNGCSTSLVSNTVPVTTTAPVAPTATNADNFTCVSFNANWGAVTGATSYSIEVSTNASFSTYQTGYNNFSVGNVTTYNVSGLTIGLNYFYRIKASNGCSTSLVSNTIPVTTTAPVSPTAVSATNFTCVSFNANWGAVGGATSYSIEVSTNASFTTYQTGYANFSVGNVTTYNVSGLTIGVNYFYRIKASNGCSTSLVSNTIPVTTTAPVAPTATNADNFTCVSFNANWGAVTGATSYSIEVSTSASFSTYQTGYNNFNVGNVTTYNVSGLTIGVNYFYRIKASNGCSVSLVSNSIPVSTTAPVAPTGTDANNFTCNSFNANWGAVTGATSYILEVSTNASFSTFQGTYNSSNNVGNVTTLNVTGLTTGLVYYYRIKASNGCSVSLNSNTIIVSTTAPVSPTATPATNFTCTSFNANWGAVSGATSYIIDVSTSSSFATTLTGYTNLTTGNVTTLNVTGLGSNTTYYYRVKSTNGCSTSLPSNTISVGTSAPVAPIATSASNFTCTSFNANWAAVTGATQYFIDVSSDANFTAGSILAGYNDLNVANVNTFIVTGLTINTTYFYRVRADNGCSFSANSNTINVTTTSPIAPIALNADNFSCTTFNANWSASIGATSYLLDVSTTGSFTAGTFVLNGFNVGSATTYNVIGLAQNTTYYYRIRSVNGCATSGNSNIVVVTISAPIAPNAIDASNITCTSLNANWGVSSGATGYYLDVATTANFAPGSFITPYNNAFMGNTNTYNIIGLSQGVTYYYRVNAINGCATSVYSNTVTASTTAPTAPIALNGSNFTCTSFNANWSPVLGAVAYYLDVATDAGFTAPLTGYNNLNVGTANTYPITGLAQNADYYYRVRAANICATSTSSNSTTVTTSAPIAPTSSGASNLTCTSFNANWGATVGATTYYLDVATDANYGASIMSGYNNLPLGNVTTYNVTGLTVNNTYYYRVRAGNGCSISLNSNGIMVVTAAPFSPIAVAPSNLNCTSFNANWGGSVGAITYYLDVSTSATFSNFFNPTPNYNNLNVGNVTTYNITGLTQGITYYYRVRAASGCTTSPPSNTESATIAAPSAPAALPATNVACVSFNANWASVSGATTYIIDVSTVSTFATFITGFNGLNTNGNVTTYNISGAPQLVQGGTYYFRVRAVNGCNTSGNSNLVSLTTAQVNAPVALAASDIACTVLNANWTAVSGVTGYLLDVSTSASFATTFVTSQSVGNVTTYNVTGLGLNTTYYYRVRATSACATSTNSNSISAATTAPAAPNASAGTNITCTSMNANWSVVTGVIGYYLDVSTDGNFGSFIGIYNNLSVNNVTTYNVTGLPGTTVYYRVRSATACTQSVNSNMITVNPSAIVPPAIGAPTGVACTVFNANWGSVGGALSYELDVSTSASFATTLTAYSALNVGAVTTYNVSGLSVNNTYYYRVRSKNACVTSTNSITQTASTNAPSPPTISLATNVTCTSMNANWSGVPVAGAITYYLDVSTDANFGTFVLQNQDVGGANVSSFNVTGLTGTTVYYRLRSASACASGGNSSTQSVNPSAIAAPGANPASGVACSTFNANWVGVTGALSYEIDVSTSAAFSTIIAAYNDLDVGNVTTFNVSGLSVNNVYYYRVRAKNACVTSSHSTTITASTNAPNAPVIGSTYNITCTSFNVVWTAVADAITYYIDISTSASFATTIAPYSNFDMGVGTPGNVAGTSTYNASGITGQTPPYYFRIRAASGCASGPNSVVTAVNPASLAPPTSSVATGITCTVFTANWAVVAGALSYEIDVSTTATFATYITGFNALNIVGAGTNSYTVSGAEIVANKTYYYRVRAKNACITSSASAIITASTTAPNSPTFTAASNVTCGSFTANWNAVTGALDYFIDVSTDQTFTTSFITNQSIGYVSPTSYAVTGLSQNNIYYYRLRAMNGCSTSGSSSFQTVTTTSPSAPGILAVSSSSCTSFLAPWTAVGGATSYEIDVAYDASFSSFLTGYQDLNVGNVTSVNVTGIVAGQIYYYRVRSVNLCGNSGNSGFLTFKREDPAIPGPGVSSFACSAQGVCWSLVSSASAYLIDVAYDPSFSAFHTGSVLYQNYNVGNTNCLTVNGLASPPGPGEYYFRMRATNSCGTSGYSDVITLITRAPDAPNTYGITASPITCNSFTAIWGASIGATSYLLDVSTSSTFATFLPAYSGFNPGSTTSYNIPSLSAGTYYYRVRGNNGCGTPVSSATVTVIVGSAPSVPVAQNEGALGNNSFVANWDASTSGNATTYYLDVSTDQFFGAGNFLSGYNAKNVGNVTSATVSGLPTGWNPGTTYYYRVRAGNGCGTSAASNFITVP